MPGSGSAEEEEFPFRVRLGIFLLFESAGLSACAVTILLSYVAFRAFKRYWARRALRKRMRNEWMNSLQFSLHTEDQTDATDSSFFIGLMFGELIQAIGGLFDIQWVLDGKVTEGPLCTVQGLFKQYGDVTVAFMSLTIAIQTFCTLVIRWYIPRWASKYILAADVAIVTVLVGTSTGVLSQSGSRGRYYGDTGYWCWIGNNYKTEKIVFEYLWMWLAASIMLVLYGVSALVMRGILVMGDEHKDERSWTLSWNSQPKQSEAPSRRRRDLVGPKDKAGEPDDSEDRRQAKAVANLILFYPAVYIFCVFPIALARWLAFSGHSIAPSATLVTDFIFTLSGLLNSILYVCTRPELVKGSNTDSCEDTGRQLAYGTGAVRRKTSRAQSKHHVRSNETRSLPKLHGLGHLPDRSDDDFREQETHIETDIAGDADGLPWVARRPSQCQSHTPSRPYTHSRSGSGNTASGSAIIVGGSPDNIRLSRLRTVSLDSIPPQPFVGPMISGQLNSADQDFLRQSSSGSQRQIQVQRGQRKFASSDIGLLPGVDPDVERDYDGGDVSQAVQLVVPRHEEDRRRWEHWDWSSSQDPAVSGLPPERDASESVRWSNNMEEGIPHAL